MSDPTSPFLIQPPLDELLPTPQTKALFQQTYASLEAGWLVRRWREAAGLTQVQLAERLGLTQARISAVEKGRGRDGPTYGLMQRLASACGVGWPGGTAQAPEPMPKPTASGQAGEAGVSAATQRAPATQAAAGSEPAHGVGAVRGSKRADPLEDAIAKVRAALAYKPRRSGKRSNPLAEMRERKLVEDARRYLQLVQQALPPFEPPGPVAPALRAADPGGSRIGRRKLRSADHE